LHRLWNRRLAETLLKRSSPNVLLDLCAGTGEIAGRMLRKRKEATCYLVDFSQEMLACAKKRFPWPNVHCIQADAQALPFEANLFDSVSVAYGIRNVENMSLCFQEIYRTLKPGGWLGIAELTRPNAPLLSFFHRVYLRTMVPLIGKMVTQNQEAYSYLCRSIEVFLPPKLLLQALKNSGFINIEAKAQTLGIATLFFAQKPGRAQ
jgi:demethylmenaquinone methyltransferase/2-methoxy-6-polyprenyl-1,4-benzoquinol methylase